MFYQLYSIHGGTVNQPRSDIPLLIWLQGGPGSSSQFGAHTEVGPIKIVNGDVRENDYSWNLFGHMLFIDSPLNTGFSWSGNRTGEKQVGSTDDATNHLINFLENFYTTWPALRLSPLYLTGESFAGHYIPVLAWKLLNKKEMNVTVAGVSIGDGWTDPINQINFYDTYLWSVGVIDRGFRQTCTWYQTNGLINIHHSEYKKVHNRLNIGD
jgi:carboxypeptidase C (cathepsin A)